jgi:hypothetical protein
MFVDSPGSSSGTQSNGYAVWYQCAHGTTIRVYMNEGIQNVRVDLLAFNGTLTLLLVDGQRSLPKLEEGVKASNGIE